MIHKEGRFKGARNKEIAYQVWQPDGPIKAGFLLVHGLGEHCGRYTNLVNHLLSMNYSVYALDHIGHGKSDGTRKFVSTFADFTDTLDLYLDYVKEWHAQKPLFLLGHSMGGLIATDYLLTKQQSFNGVVLSAPALELSDNVSTLRILFGKLLAIIAPKSGIVPINPTKVSRDERVVTAYMHDPLIYKGKATARLASEILKAMSRVKAGASQLKLPLLILQGTADVIVNPNGAKQLYESVSSSDKTLKLYEGLYHEVFNEPEKEQVFEDLQQWLLTHDSLN